jgi:hypothetical protein
VSHLLDLNYIYAKKFIEIAIQNEAQFPDDEEYIQNLLLSSDERFTLLPQYHAIAVAWIKFHNVVASHLKLLHPSLSSVNLFYETRRFVIAVYQSIWYNEVLPLIVSMESSTEFRLASTKNCYNENIQPVVSVEFTSTVARNFHKFIHNEYIVRFKNGTSSSILLRNLYNNMIGYDEFIGVIKGLLDDPWNTHSTASETSNYLFTTNNRPSFDLRALDIQKERDMGTATYCDALYYYHLTDDKCIKKFADFETFTSKDNIEFLKYAYLDPCDVDLSVGGDMHDSSTDGMLSDIFDKIFAEQFYNLKCGDPYFYTNALSEG